MKRKEKKGDIRKNKAKNITINKWTKCRLTSSLKYVGGVEERRRGVEIKNNHNFFMIPISVIVHAREKGRK